MKKAKNRTVADWLLFIVIVIVVYAISWAVSVGLIYLITLLLDINFSIKIATALWIGMALLGSIFKR